MTNKRSGATALMRQSAHCKNHRYSLGTYLETMLNRRANKDAL